jgi:hypothetical protein
VHNRDTADDTPVDIEEDGPHLSNSPSQPLPPNEDPTTSDWQLATHKRR